MFKQSIPVLLSVLLSTLVFGAMPAFAGSETEPLAPAWNVRAIVGPTNLPPGGEGVVLVIATNLGDLPASASGADPVRITAKLPAGVTATSIGVNEHATPEATNREPFTTCDLEESSSLGTCETTGAKVLLYEPVEIVIHVSVAKRAHSGQIEMSASGAGAPTVSASDPLTVDSAPVQFGLQSFEMQPFNADGSLDTQAGSHPFQFTTTLAYNQSAGEATPPPYANSAVKKNWFRRRLRSPRI